MQNWLKAVPQTLPWCILSILPFKNVELLFSQYIIENEDFCIMVIRVIVRLIMHFLFYHNTN